ncbi:MAG: UTRA domain-containing protein [Streptosporangiales bacterium]|nr:UTRA domain-containing protein [Streptosporangiales bacterium]
MRGSAMSARSSPPKYLAISADLRERCLKMPVGARLPSERWLAVDFGVSLMTVRQALAELASAGWVERVAGSGTFVRRPRVEMGPSLTSFTEDMRRRNLRPSSRLISFERVATDSDVARELGVRPGDEVITVERLRFADGEPMCHELAHLPLHLLSVLESADLEGSLHEALTAATTVLVSATRKVRALPAPPRECRLLDLPVGSPALEITDTFYDTRNRPVQTARSRYRFDRYEVLSKLSRQPNNSRPRQQPEEA